MCGENLTGHSIVELRTFTDDEVKNVFTNMNIDGNIFMMGT